MSLALALEAQMVGDDPADGDLDAATQQSIQELLAELPADIRSELNLGQIDVHDPAFLNGLTDHLARLTLANPRIGRKLLGKFTRLRKSIRGTVREVDPEIPTSDTIWRKERHVGRNEPCPCGSGRKYKQCCLRMG